MSDSESVELDEPVLTVEPTKPVKKKRVLSQLQLKNLEKARVKARASLKLKRERNQAIKDKKNKVNQKDYSTTRRRRSGQTIKGFRN
jgi:hypothetical protein